MKPQVQRFIMWEECLIQDKRSCDVVHAWNLSFGHQRQREVHILCVTVIERDGHRRSLIEARLKTLMNLVHRQQLEVFLQPIHLSSEPRARNRPIGWIRVGDAMIEQYHDGHGARTLPGDATKPPPRFGGPAVSVDQLFRSDVHGQSHFAEWIPGARRILRTAAMTAMGSTTGKL